MAVLVFLLTILLVLFGYNYFKLKKEVNFIITELEEMTINKKAKKILFFDTYNYKTKVLIELLNQILDLSDLEIEKTIEYKKLTKSLLTELTHDLKTPLAGVMGYLQILMNPIETKNSIDILEKIYIKTTILKDSIDDMFEYFLIESGEKEYNNKVYDINEVMRIIIIEWVDIFREKKIEIFVDISDLPCWVSLDLVAFKRAINNIIKNIIDHSEATSVRISTNELNNEVKLIIVDNGIGIEEEKIKYIFSKLYKCDKSRRNTGTGLGLSITKGLISKMNGNISVKSKYKFYTEFEIKFLKHTKVY